MVLRHAYVWASLFWSSRSVRLSEVSEVLSALSPREWRSRRVASGGDLDLGRKQARKPAVQEDPSVRGRGGWAGGRGCLPRRGRGENRPGMYCDGRLPPEFCRCGLGVVRWRCINDLRCWPGCQ